MKKPSGSLLPKTPRLRCEKCGQLTGAKLHVCASVESKGPRHCIRCRVLLRTDNYERWKKRCGSCEKWHWRNKLRIERLHLKLQFGGKCQRCGYSKCQAVLHFHHKHGRGKHARLSRYRLTNQEIREHPERFELLCANCHGEEHFLKYEEAINNNFLEIDEFIKQNRKTETTEPI